MKSEIVAIICTYKREKYLYKNIKILEKDLKTTLKHVFVIDNGHTISKKINNDFITVVKNKNYGGSGGFARGLYEAKHYGCTHVLMMDDDIIFEPSVLLTAIGKLKNNKNDWIGFSMRSLKNKFFQYEQGAYWNGIKIKHNNHNINTSLIINQDKNLIHQKYNYSAWWSIIMPVSVLDKYGYPLPFFIKFDDIEYGLRRKNELIIFDNEFYIQHESFKNKKAPYLEYYNVRNSLVTNILHLKHSLIKSLIRCLFKFLYFYFKFDVKSVSFVIKGMSDFLKGPDIFTNNDLYKYHIEIKNLFKNKCKIHKLLILPFIFLIYYVKIIFNYKKIKHNYRSMFKTMTSETYWKKILNIY